MDFPRSLIEINSYSDQWGPFEFDFSNGLPAGDSIQSATVKSSLGGSDTTALLVESGSTVVASNTVSVRLQYPGSTNTGSHLLQFEVTLLSGAKHRFAFGYVLVS